MKKSLAVAFTEKAQKIASTAKFHRDFGDDDSSSHWLSIVFGDHEIHVEFSGQNYICFYLNPDIGFGVKPDEIYKDMELALHRIAQINGRFHDNLSCNGINPVEIRRLCLKRQFEVAGELNVKQSSVSQFESRMYSTDAIMISTLRDYLNSLGGTVEFRVNFPDFSCKIDLGSGKNSYERYIPEDVFGILPDKIKEIIRG